MQLLYVLVIGALFVVTSHASPENAQVLKQQIGFLSTNILKTQDQLADVQNLQSMKLIMDLLYAPPASTGNPLKVTNAELNTAVSQTALQTLIIRLNSKMQSLAMAPSVAFTATSRHLTFRIYASAIIASIYNRERQTLDKPTYATFISNTILAEYNAQVGTEYDDIAPDGDDETKYIPANDLLVHLWHLKDAITGVSIYESLPQVDTIEHSDDFMLITNLIYLVDCVLEASTQENDFTTTNFRYRYQASGIVGLLEKVLSFSYPGFAGIQQYVTLMQNQFFATPDSTRWDSLNVEFPLREFQSSGTFLVTSFE